MQRDKLRILFEVSEDDSGSALSIQAVERNWQKQVYRITWIGWVGNDIKYYFGDGGAESVGYFSNVGSSDMSSSGIDIWDKIVIYRSSASGRIKAATLITTFSQYNNDKFKQNMYSGKYAKR